MILSSHAYSQEVKIIGKYNYALVITNISTLLMTISVWFWNDINDEL